MSHCNNRNEAIQKKGKDYIAWLESNGWNFETDELYITDNQQTYKITNAHFNSCPMYPVFDLIPTGKHEACFYQEALQ